MQTDKIQYGTSTIEYSLAFSKRKTLGIKVYPDQSVKVTAPLNTPVKRVQEKLLTKAVWVLKQQAFFENFKPHTTVRRFISGETHLYLGKQYRLKVVPSTQTAVELKGGDIVIMTKDPGNPSQVEQLLKDWYKSKAVLLFPKLFDRLFPKIKRWYKGNATIGWRWMKSSWGTCNSKGRISLNVDLIRAHKRCIEYVLLHELCHLVHMNHSAAFYGLLGQLCPNWQSVKDELERMMV